MKSLMEIAALTAVVVADAVEKVAVDVVAKVAVEKAGAKKAVVEKAKEEKAKAEKAALTDLSLTVPDLMDLTAKAKVAAQADALMAPLTDLSFLSSTSE